MNQNLVTRPEKPLRDEKGRVLPGQMPAYLGKPKGAVGGRAKALQTLDSMLGTEGNQKLLKDALQAEFEKNPIRFFRQIIMPLLPQQHKLEIGGEGLIAWKSVIGDSPKDGQGESPKTIDVEDA